MGCPSCAEISEPYCDACMALILVFQAIDGCQNRELVLGAAKAWREKYPDEAAEQVGQVDREAFRTFYRNYCSPKPIASSARATNSPPSGTCRAAESDGHDSLMIQRQRLRSRLSSCKRDISRLEAELERKRTALERLTGELASVDQEIEALKTAP